MQLPPPITSRTNARVKALRASFSGKSAKLGELVGIEGEHLVGEALRSGMKLEAVFLREGSEALLARPALASVAQEIIVVLSRDVFASAVETPSPQGVATLVEIPEHARAALDNRGPVLVLESLQDPGNMGTLIRSAEAFGCSYVQTTFDCVNPWNPKTIRASAGSIFRMPVAQNSLQNTKLSFAEQGIRLYAAVAHGSGARSLLDIEFATAAAVMIGNEGAGLSVEAVAMADVLVTIPCAVESLNAAVAGSTILYEVMRQRKAAGR